MPRMNPQPPAQPRKPTRAELERAAELIAYRDNLDQLMPQHYGPRYCCKMCGLIVGDRQIHLNWHGESKFYNTLKDLFGEV